MEAFAANREPGLKHPIVRSICPMLHRPGIKTISLVGPQGSGKTALLEFTAARLAPHARVCVLVGGPAAGRKALRLGRFGVRALPLPSGDLDAAGVHKAMSILHPDQFDLFLIEGSADMESRSQRDYGQDLRVSVFSVAGGSDQPAANPDLVTAADLVLLTMIDLLPIENFDLQTFSGHIRRLGSDTPVIQSSILLRHGIDPWLRWLETHWIGRGLVRGEAEPPADPFADLSL